MFSFVFIMGILLWLFNIGYFIRKLTECTRPRKFVCIIMWFLLTLASIIEMSLAISIALKYKMLIKLIKKCRNLVSPDNMVKLDWKLKIHFCLMIIQVLYFIHFSAREKSLIEGIIFILSSIQMLIIQMLILITFNNMLSKFKLFLSQFIKNLKAVLMHESSKNYGYILKIIKSEIVRFKMVMFL